MDKRADRANEVAQNTVKNPNLTGEQPGNGNGGNNGGGNDNPGGGNGGGNDGNNGGGQDGGSVGTAGPKDPLDTGGSFLYFYHPDHLGSTGYVTDANAAIYEHIEYFPFGETWVEEATNTYQRVPYRFTGKELDEETGLYYYGARYYDPRTSVWQSADPALNDYFDSNSGLGGIYNSKNMALYTYVQHSPLKNIDPDGRKTFSIDVNMIANIFPIKNKSKTAKAGGAIGIGGGISLSVPTPWDEKDTVFDVAFTAKTIREANVSLESDTKNKNGNKGKGVLTKLKKMFNAIQVSGELSMSEGNTVSKENKSLNSSTDFGVVSFGGEYALGSNEKTGSVITFGKVGVGKSVSIDDTDVFSGRRFGSSLLDTASSWADNLPSSFSWDSNYFNRTYDYHHEKYTEEHK